MSWGESRGLPKVQCSAVGCIEDGIGSGSPLVLAEDGMPMTLWIGVWCRAHLDILGRSNQRLQQALRSVGTP